ncbi:MAG TPA: hypothetical protein VMD04_04245 [Candidatus Margulisiibacteriota bacterium]|nr:hypothetical protein [Candidatus Margulisiibacteriota bacterium]
MQDILERIVKLAYKRWRSSVKVNPDWHPDEEMLACFMEGRLNKEESERLRGHLIVCEDCIEKVALQIEAEDAAVEVPRELLERVRAILSGEAKCVFWEIVLKFKEKMVEIVNTTGDILVGQELMPAALLRSRSIKDFKDEVTILKDVKDIRIEAKVENKGEGVFNLSLMAKEKGTQKIIKDLRATLIKEDVELESCLTDSGSVTFEHVLLGKYTVEISSTEGKVASIILEIKA